ncbi:protein rep [Acetobacter pasteurianus]|uniref:protein rep n=1 Tax=Acetobacter pasteurianus TaxID=438 RepID=UPI00202FBD86|nr:protein rep [Acetobacter pasteurianus]
MQAIYGEAREFERLAERIGKCAGVLRFSETHDPETGEAWLKLKEAQFCRVRHCPVCQWRRSLMWQARFYQALPGLIKAHTGARWLFLTLTVRNCPVEDLRATLKAMNDSWRRLVLRPEFKLVQGWIRTTEVTRGKDGSAHPHFHALLMVPPSYFRGQSYVKQARWVDVWQSCARLNYAPSVDVRAVHPRKGADGELQAIQQAAAETLKYAVKPADMTTDPEWFMELTRQVHKLRFVATGGALKDVLKEGQESDEELALTDGDGEQDDGGRVGFNWRPADRKYRRYRQADAEPSALIHDPRRIDIEDG